MNRSELITAFSNSNELSLEDATMIVNAFFDAIRSSLVNGDRIEIRGFGSFTMKEYKGYTGRNPKSGDTVTVAPKRLPSFRLGKELKGYLNQK
jgi:integration host factor subunit beta